MEWLAPKATTSVKLVQKDRHIEIDRGRDPIDWDGRVVREVLGAEQAFLFSGVRHEQDRSPRAFGARRERTSNLEQRGNSCGVVERAVVDVIAGPAAGDTDVIGVGHQRDVLILQRRIGTADDAHDLRTRELAGSRRRDEPGAGLHREGCGPCAFAGSVENLRQSRRQSIEERLSGGLLEDGCRFEATGRIERCPVLLHPRRGRVTAEVLDGSQGIVTAMRMTPTAPCAAAVWACSLSRCAPISLSIPSGSPQSTTAILPLTSRPA